jgi:acetyl-CoA acetyltransferase
VSNQLGNKTAIVGIGATEFSKDSGRSEMKLACEAVLAAINDAGLAPSDIDGMVTYSADNNPEIEIARHLGIGELRHFSRVHYGGGAACGTIELASMAVATGVADYVVCYRAFNERSGRRFGSGVQDLPNAATAERAQFSYTSLQKKASPMEKFRPRSGKP